MTEEQLKDGEVLFKTIQTTEKGLEKLEDLLLKIETEPRQRDNKYHDGMYNIFVGVYKDGSGGGAELSRYGNNLRLLKIIVKELELQLSEMKLEFENL